MILKLGMLHWGLKLHKVYINDDPGLTLTYFTARSNWVTYTFEWGKQKTYDLETWHVALGTQAPQSLYKWWSWVDLDLFYGKVKLGHLYVWMGKTVIKSFNWGGGELYWLNNTVNEKILTPGGCLPQPQGYILVYDHHFQTRFPLKPLGQSKPNFMWGLLGKGERKFI